MSFSNDFQTLLTLAEAYFHLGYSVIPLLGDADPSRSKVPAVPWSAFQQYRASLDDHQSWFTQSKFAGLGIVTGRVSQLVVLDFDSEATFNTFKGQYPDLIETHTVRSASRQLPHLYFRLSPHLHLPSQKGQGIDLLSDGRYVVAPPTTFKGQSYTITRGGMPKTLTERDVRRIQSFLNTHKLAAPAINQPTAPIATPQPVNLQPEVTLTADDLHAIYRHLVASRGRNEALFHTSLLARDRRLSLHQTQTALVPLHCQQKGSRTHRPENIQQREREAHQTIRSAFSRPARVPSSDCGEGMGKGLLSNSVREALMQHKMTAVVRTLEGLLQSGMQPGQRFTAAEAVKRLSGLVGRDSVLNALKAGQGDQGFFIPPVSPRKTANAVANDLSQNQSKKCFLIVSKNQEKIKRGRPNRLYRLPTNRDLCRLLGVKATRSDALERADLRTASQTRMALHRELIKRRPGRYSKRWFAARLGVSRRTIFTYNHLIPIHSRPLFLETAIGWKTLERLPLDEPLHGAFIQTPRGKKYPALRQIASRLLARGESVCLKQQTANFYWYGDVEPSSQEWITTTHQQAHKQAVMETFLARQPEPVVSPIISSPPRSTPNRQKPAVLPRTAALKPLDKDSHEKLARQLYEALNQMGGADFQKLSHAAAHQLVTTYDQPLLLHTLDALKKRATTGQIRNPVGFFITLIRTGNRSRPV